MKSKHFTYYAIWATNAGYLIFILNIYSLSNWLDDMERQIGMLAMPALRPEQIAQQQDKNEVYIFLQYTLIETHY